MDVIGLRREREVLTVALQTDRHVVLEGPPGTGKSTLLRAIAAEVGTEVVFVEGNAELTPARLVGQYDPAAVMAEGYVPSSFTDGPLLTAMRGSGLLYLEELNRIPEETLNVLITVLTEGEIAVPRLGRVRAAAGFRLIAAMNPFDAIGTARWGRPSPTGCAGSCWATRTPMPSAPSSRRSPAPSRRRWGSPCSWSGPPASTATCAPGPRSAGPSTW